MKELLFKAKLLTDIVLNQKAATEGNQESLDFIPGNNFLGIAAGKLYKKLTKEENLIIFHSGKVRFGDAHPSLEGGKRTFHIPASMYYSKLGKDRRILVHHKIPTEKNEEIQKFQLKQFRSGFYDLSRLEENTSLYTIKADIKKSFAIKSAYDRDKRRSADEQMYGYESLKRGSHWRFSVLIEDEVPLDLITHMKEALIGECRIGRSKTAQYGLIEIEYIDQKGCTIPKVEIKKEDYIIDGEVKEENYVLVYAESRLIFLDDFGLPTFQPKPEELGFASGEIDWQKSQVRTFQYAPWNSKRQTRDTDRCGIEKGSVFYIKQKEGIETLNYEGNGIVGFYQNEGFGKIRINPDFLNTKGKLGESNYFNNKPEPKKESTSYTIDQNYDDPVFLFLKQQHEKEQTEMKIYELVNEFVEGNKKDFLDENFSSQWGSIRKLALQYPDQEKCDTTIVEYIMEYITRGVAKEKWDKYGRAEKLSKFFNSIIFAPEAGLDNESIQLVIINLSAQMAQISKK